MPLPLGTREDVYENLAFEPSLPCSFLKTVVGKVPRGGQNDLGKSTRDVKNARSR